MQKTLSLPLTFLGLFSLSGCAITMTKPCTQTGDLDNIPKIRGDMICYQKETEDGRIVTHGAFSQRHPNGVIAIEGNFNEGKKTGYWYFYNEKGVRYLERYFNEFGVETSGPKSDPALEPKQMIVEPPKR